MKPAFLILLLFYIPAFSYGQGNWNGNVKSWEYDLKGARTTYPDKMATGEWINHINREHPRLFVNNNTLADMRNYITNNQSLLFNNLVRDVDLLPDDAPFIFNNGMIDELPSGEIVPKANSSAA